MTLNAEIVLVISILLVLILIFKKVNIAIALGIGTALYGISTLGYNTLNATLNAFNLTMLEVISALTLAMFLAGLFSSLGVSSKMVEGLSVLGERFAAISTPAVVGLLPMPGGAYVSAVMTKSLYQKMGLKPQEETFINYWFRHIWVTSWPLFQGVILAAGILGTSAQSIIKITWPVTLIAILTGLVIALPKLKNSGKIKGKWSELIHLWPFILIGIFSVFMGINVAIATALVVLFFIIIYKPKKPHYKEALKHASNITILSVLILSLIFSEYIKESGIATKLAMILGPLGELVTFFIPFLIGLATGIEFTYVALAFPPLLPFLTGQGLILAFTGGYMGVMLSPGHSCLILSSQHYEAELHKVYKLVVPAVIITTILVFTFSTMIQFFIH